MSASSLLRTPPPPPPCVLAGMPTDTDEQIAAAAQALQAQGVGTVLVKLGARGSLLVGGWTLGGWEVGRRGIGTATASHCCRAPTSLRHTSLPPSRDPPLGCCRERRPSGAAASPESGEGCRHHRGRWGALLQLAAAAAGAAAAAAATAWVGAGRLCPAGWAVGAMARHIFLSQVPFLPSPPGDCFTAAFVVALLEGRGHAEAMRFATAAAALCIQASALAGAWGVAEADYSPRVSTCVPVRCASPCRAACACRSSHSVLFLPSPLLPLLRQVAGAMPSMPSRQQVEAELAAAA